MTYQDESSRKAGFDQRPGHVVSCREGVQVSLNIPRAVFDARDDADALPLLERRLQPLSVREGELEQETERMTENVDFEMT